MDARGLRAATDAAQEAMLVCSADNKIVHANDAAAAAAAAAEDGEWMDSVCKCVNR